MSATDGDDLRQGVRRGPRDLSRVASSRKSRYVVNDKQRANHAELRVARLEESNATLRATNRALRAAVRDLEKMLDIAKGKE